MGLERARTSRLSGSSSDGSALMRAAGARERDPLLRCPDSLARRLIGDLPLARLVDGRVSHRLLRGAAERRNPGAYWYEIARVKHFDALLLGEVERKVPQFVILGAGLDSRAYRFADQLAYGRVFEADHPVTAARKRRRVSAALGGPPKFVRYVDVDLSKDVLATRLAAAGFDSEQPVFVLWSGVTMYLREETMSSVLDWLSRCPKPSSVAFDYDFEAFIAGDDRFYGAAPLRRFTERLGEPHTLGLDPGTVGEYLDNHGLRLESNLLPDELAQRYLRTAEGTPAGKPYGFIAIAHARVRNT